VDILIGTVVGRNEDHFEADADQEDEGELNAGPRMESL